MKNIDAIIVGQGISGSVMSAQLIKAGKTCLVIDNEAPITASKVSAGIYNPIVFKRVVKSWMIDELLPVMQELYTYMEEQCNSKFHFDRKIVKVFVNEEEKTQWLSKSVLPEFKDYLSPKIDIHNFNNCIVEHAGLAEVNKAGYLDVDTMLPTWKDFLLSNESYINTNFKYSDLLFENEKVTWNNYEAKYIIFCEGYEARHNPYFKDLPFVPAKGEVLSVTIPSLDANDKVLNKGVFVLPTSNNNFKVGATYVWNKIDNEITQEGKEELIQKLEKLLQVPYEITKQKAGIRPSTKDRRPWVGKHNSIPQIALLNGMGTKAVMLAPYFAHQLFEHLYFQKNIHPEANINRIY